MGAALLFALTLQGFGQNPDLTNGEPRLDDNYWNLGPTGMTGWMYREDWDYKYSWNSSQSRQIEVIAVDPGSPADGVLQAGDVILGADGTGATPVDFISDARKAFAAAIADAEANNPAELKLRVWRAGTTSTMSITLEYLGAYSATAPYNGPKSAAVLEKGLDAITAETATDGWNFSKLITLVAGNDPTNPDNAARMTLAQQEAHSLILSQADIDYYTFGAILGDSNVGWRIGFQLMALAEYYLLTNDAAGYDSLRAYAIAYANGQSMFGTTGHRFSKVSADGPNGPYGVGYGVINNANLQSFYGLLLAKEAGVNDQEVLDAIDRAANFYTSYADRGTIPYGENGPAVAHENNGKSASPSWMPLLIDARVIQLGKILA